MDSCKIDLSARMKGDKSSGAASEFEKLRDEMQSDLYWVRFFARPCCPAPDAAGATKMLEHLKSDVGAQEGFSEAQKAELRAIIDERNEWYPTSGLCRK